MTIDMNVIPLAIETGIRRFLYLTDIDGAPYEYKLKYVVRDLTKEIFEDKNKQEEDDKTSSGKLKNKDVYKTPEERSEAFLKWCDKETGGDGVKPCEEDCSVCQFKWLNREAEQEVDDEGN